MKKRATKVPSSGDTNCKIALVGEQPGRMEVRYRKPFKGPAGTELDSCLSSAKISRLQCYITNVIKDLDYPLEQYIKFRKTSVTVSEDGQEYIQELKEELSKCSANVIVAIGNVALYALASRRGIMNWRGSIIESTLLPGKKVIPTINPATIIQPKNVYLNKRLIISDLIKAEKESYTSSINTIPRKIKIKPLYIEVIEFLNECFIKGIEGKLINFDIEIYNHELSCLSFAHSPTFSMSIPFIDFFGDYFTIEQEAEVWKLIAKILEDEKITKSNQNIGFDNSMLLSFFGIKTHNVVDTMINQKILYPDYPAGLDFITTMHTDIPYYKKDGKKWFKIGGAWETEWHYNGLDSVACLEALPSQERDILKQGNKETVLRQTKIIEPLVYMMNKGIRVDSEGMLKSKTEMESQLVTLQKDLNSMTKMKLNPNSPKQLANYFYNQLGHKPYLKKGKITTDDTALVRLLRKGVKEAALIKKMRTLRKLASTYTDINKLDSDGRIRCSWNPVGTKSGRISSSKTIFDKGTNMQNWPHPLLRFLLSDEGCIYYSIDLSQVENRIVAYVGRIPRMIDAFESGKDVHALTASLIFDKSIEEISDEEGSSSLGTGTQSERFYGKKTGHSCNYDLGYRKFALMLEIPENESKWLIERYHKIYPEIRGNYHQLVKSSLAKDRTLTNLFGRKRLFLDKWGDDLFKDAYAQIPQSTVADKINEQGLSYIYYNQDKFKEVELLIQVHDSIGFQIPLSAPWIRHAEILWDIKQSLETPVKWNDVEFTIPSDICMGLNLCKNDGVEFKHNKFPNSITNLAINLKRAYEKELI